MEEREREAVVNEKEVLPSPEELIPLSQSLVDRNLASAFDIPTTINPNSTLYPIPPSPLIPSHPNHQGMDRTNCDSRNINGCYGSRFGFKFKKKKRTIWTPQLHRKFVEAVVRLGLENAAPIAITEEMNVDGLSKESVNSHLQQFRSRLKREGLLIKSGRNWRSLVPDEDLTTDRLFALIPLPLGSAAARGDERSDSEEKGEEGCEESEELSPFPTGKDLSDDTDSCRSDDDEVFRTKKKRRTVWTLQLHKKFTEAVAHLGVQNATPKAITETMNVDGLSRDSVSSHLQKYRQFLEQKANQIGKGVKKKVVLPGDSAMDRQITTTPLPSRPASAPAGVDEGSFPFLFMNMTSATVEHLSYVIGSEERSKEGCREIRELSLFPTGKDLSDDKENSISDDDEVTKTKKGSTAWTPKLYKMFADTVAHLGLENATPGAIMEKMNVEGLSRDSVSSQLQRYRYLLEQELHRKKKVSAGHSTMDQLFATIPLPYGAAPPRGDERRKLEETVKIVCEEIKELPLFPTGKDLRYSCGGNDNEPAKPNKKWKSVWTLDLHKTLVEVVTHLGLENATPAAITGRMNVDGLTEEIVSSYLQQYRLYLQRMGLLIYSEGKWQRKNAVSAPARD